MEQVTKIGQMTLAQIIKAIESMEGEADFFVKANAVLGKEKVEQLILEQQNLHQARGISVGLSVVMGAIRKAVRVASAEKIKAIAAGQWDTVALSAKGKKRPGRAVFLRVGKPAIDMTIWGNSLKKEGGADAGIVYPSLVEMTVEKTPYTTSDGKPGERFSLMDVVDTKVLSGSEFAKKLIANIGVKKLSEIKESDLYSPVVIKGKIDSMSPEPILEMTQEGDEVNKAKYEKTGELEILQPDATDDKLLHPVLQISLRIEQGTAVRLHLEQRKAMHGTYLMEEFREIVDQAVAECLGKPSDQAAYVGQFFVGRAVAVVGTVRQVRAPDGINGGIKNIDISVVAIVDIPLDLPVVAGDEKQRTLTPPEPEAPAPAPVEKKAIKPKLGTDEAEIGTDFNRIAGLYKLKHITDMPLETIFAKTKIDAKYPKELIEAVYNKKLAEIKPKDDVPEIEL